MSTLTLPEILQQFRPRNMREAQRMFSRPSSQFTEKGPAKIEPMRNRFSRDGGIWDGQRRYQAKQNRKKDRTSFVPRPKPAKVREEAPSMSHEGMCW